MPNQNDPTQDPSSLPPKVQNLPINKTSTTPPINQSINKPIGSSIVKKKFGTGKIIAYVLGIVVIVGGIGAGIILIRRQLSKQKASGLCNPACSGVASYCRDIGPTGPKYSTTYLCDYPPCPIGTFCVTAGTGSQALAYCAVYNFRGSIANSRAAIKQCCPPDRPAYDSAQDKCVSSTSAANVTQPACSTQGSCLKPNYCCPGYDCDAQNVCVATPATTSAQTCSQLHSGASCVNGSTDKCGTNYGSLGCSTVGQICGIDCTTSSGSATPR